MNVVVDICTTYVYPNLFTEEDLPGFLTFEKNSQTMDCNLHIDLGSSHEIIVAVLRCAKKMLKTLLCVVVLIRNHEAIE